MTTPDFPPPTAITVGALVPRDNGVLMVRQTYGTMRGAWGFPTGYVDAGETLEAAAVRETLEEAGVVAEVEGLLNLTALDYQGGKMLYIVFLCRYVSGAPTPDGVETDAAAFLDRAALAELPVEDLCRWLALRVLNDEMHALPAADVSPLCSLFTYTSTYAG